MATLWAGILFFLFAICPPPSGACTLFTAKGSMVGDRGVLIAKNRDNSKNLVTELRFVAPEKGFRFLGLFDPEADGYVVSGINEKGLTVVNASATSLPDEKRNVATEDLTDRILTTFSSVDGVLHEEAMFAASHPAFYILADTAKIAVVEVAPGGKISLRSTADGILTHTNHYLDRKFSGSNERPTPGSRKRLDRINGLLAGSRLPLGFEQFILLTEDKSGTGNDSIRQACGDSKKVCTLATWVAFLPREGFPELYVKIVKPGHTDEIRRFTLDAPFWAQPPRKAVP